MSIHTNNATSKTHIVLNYGFSLEILIKVTNLAKVAILLIKICPYVWLIIPNCVAAGANHSNDTSTINYCVHFSWLTLGKLAKEKDSNCYKYYIWNCVSTNSYWYTFLQRNGGTTRDNHYGKQYLCMFWIKNMFSWIPGFPQHEGIIWKKW
jgi:hypothetical protein